MNADAFRYLYDYHFNENRKTWDEYISGLTDEQFIREAGYSHGSVRNQIVHILNVDDGWFSELQGLEDLPRQIPDGLNDRKVIRAKGDAIEKNMRAYLAGLRDDMLLTQPIKFEEDKNMFLWQVLLHVVNHATDHRAQLLRLLNDMEIKTGPQDFVFYINEHPLSAGGKVN